MAEIAILVIDPCGRKHAQLVDDYRPLRELIPQLVRRLGLPPDLSYQVIPTDNGRPLPVNHSLAQSDIPPGAELRLAPLRDSLYDEVLRILYKEAKDYVRDRLIERARQKLEELHRVDPNYPDPAGIVHVVYSRTADPRSYEAEGRDAPRRGRSRRRDLDYGRDAAVSSAPTAAAGAGAFGKLVGTIIFCGMIAAGGYAAWQDPTARGWIKKQVAQVTGKPAASGDVLAALRETGKEQGWNNEICEELPKEKMKDLVALFDPEMKTVDVRMYMLGDRRTGNLEGIPMSNRYIMVGEYDKEETAKLFMDNVNRNLDSMYPGKVSRVKIANCDDCVRLKATLQEIDISRSFARKGRYVIMYDSGVEEPQIGTERIETIYTSLGKRLPAK